MESEIECYCCVESSLISDTVISETGKICTTEVDIFKKTIEDKDILELHSNVQKNVSSDKEGKITAEGFRHAAYGTFLRICSLRVCGKGRRYVLRSCTVKRIRDLYPSLDGKDTDFQLGAINSRM